MNDKRPSVAEIVETRYADLLRFVRSRVRDPKEVRDIAQEAFLRLLRRDRDELIVQPEAYLFRIAANLAFEQRLRHERTITQESFEDLVDEASSPESTASNREELAALNTAIMRLPPLPRAALLLQRRDGLSYEEIAEHLGTTKHMVKKYLSKALQACRASIAQDESDD